MMRAYRPLAVVAFACSLVGCSRERPWREPLGARLVSSTFHPGSLLALRAGIGPDAANALNASFPAATYRADQAAAGKQVYDATCARCHPPGQLEGATFASSWKDRRLYSLYSLISNTMPLDRPGSLVDTQYVNVIAYLLQRNQVPSGTGRLAADTLGMKKVRIALGDAGPQLSGGTK